MQQLDFSDSSPMFLRRSSNASSLNDDEDDGFLDVLDDHMEVRRPRLDRPVVGRLGCSVILFALLQEDSGMPMGMASLLTAPLVADSAAEDSVSPILGLRPDPPKV